MTILSIILLVIIFLLISVFVIFVVVYKGKQEKRITFQISSLIERHYGEIKNIYSNMRGWRHDFHNHIQTMKGFSALKQANKISDYLLLLDKDLISVDTMIKSGNITLDAILNSKVSLAMNKNIKTNISVFAKENMTVSDIDLCVIIGNLLDNAIDANELIEDDNLKFIRIYIGKLKEQLYISITNATASHIRNTTGIYITSKNKAMHGNGLKRVDLTVAKYDGYINRQNEPGVFATEILLPQ